MKLPITSAIAAIGNNGALGRDNKLLWHIPEDFKHFKTVTSGHVVIMGRKTFDSIGKPLPNRTNIVISRQVGYTIPGVIICSTLEDALVEAKKHEREEIFIIGGATVYAQALVYLDRLYLTLVHADFEADTFFPTYSELFSKVIEETEHSNDHYRYTFVTLEK